MAIVLESVLLKGVLYLTTVLATLRAGSRALYTIGHGGTIGLMDGPLILGPEDVLRLEKESCDRDIDGQFQDDMDDEPIQVSPLWESTYAFQQAVKLLYNLDEGDREHITKLGVHSTTKQEREILEGYYSMAAPHKSYQAPAFVAPTTLNINTASLKLNEGHVQEEKSLVLVVEDETKIAAKKSLTEPMYFPNFMSNSLKKFKRVSTDAITKGVHTSKEIRKICFPPIWNADTKEKKGDVRKEPLVDHDIILSTIIDIPCTGIPSNGKLNESQLKRVAEVKAFAPRTFRTLRSWFGINENDFIASIAEKGPFVSFQSNSKGAARVGGFFFFTRDGVYMIKTIKKAEISSILEMLPKYFEFMRRNAKRSLLTRFCGLYSAKVSEVSENMSKENDEQVFLIMNCVFPAEASKFISERFDLKGSTVGRECSVEEKEEKGSNAILKDLDLANEVSVMGSLTASFKPKDCGITIGPSAKSALLSQLRRDLSLLVECNVMDYSLLVGVVNMSGVEATQRSNSLKSSKDALEKGLSKSKRYQRRWAILNFLTAPIRQLCAPILFIGAKVCSLVQSITSSVLTVPLPYYGAGACGIDCGPHSILHGSRLGHRAMFYMGVIDFLQPWTMQKVIEREVKGIMGYDTKSISCMHPKEYASRFLDFMNEHIN